MSVFRNMLAAWRHPRRIMQAQLAGGLREDRALIYLMGGCFLNFIATWPVAMRVQQYQGIDAREQITGSLFLWIFLAPLVFYAIAALSHLVAKLAGGKGGFFGARLALFWAWLAAAPAALLYGLMRGFNGDTTGTAVVGAVWGIGFLVIWIASLSEAERKGA